MRLPVHLVTLILFAVAVTATPPPGHVHRPSDDKNPPSYRYGYEIGDAAGTESQGKVETRSGELASGRYYVNEGKSSSDVKYFADEWGYHPLVKYSAADDHSSATAHFALGEHVVKALLNGTEVGEEVKLPVDKRHSINHNFQQSNIRRRPTQAVQSYSPAGAVNDAGGSPSSSSAPKSQPTDDHEPSSTVTTSPVNLQLNYDLQRTFSSGSKFHDASKASSGFQENFNNYVTLPRTSANDRDHQRQSEVRAAYLSTGSASSTTPDYRSFSRGSTYVTNPSTSGSLRNGLQVDSHHENHEARHESSNDLFSTLPDDLLLVQNAGSFGRRLNPTAPSHLANGIESVTRRAPTDLPQRASTTIVPSYASHSTSTTPRTSVSHRNDLEDRRQFPTTPIPDFHDIANSVTAEALSKEYRNSLNRESSLTGSYADIFAKIFPNGPTQKTPTEKSSLKNSPLLTNETGETNSTATNPERATTPGLSAYGKRRDHELYVTLRESLDSKIRDFSRLYSSTPQTLSTFGSKPIVVAELMNYNRDKAFEYSTTFPCTDESYPSSTTVASVSSTDGSSIGFSDQILVTPKLQSSGGHATATSVSNQVQGASPFAGPGENGPIASDDRSRATPAPVTENIDGEPSNVEPLINFSAISINELEKISDDRYEKINPAFGQSSSSEMMDIAASAKYSGDQGASSLGSDPHDQRIEIQKSVEIYQNSPVHEIHYPPQVISQVSGINHQVQQQQQQQQQQREDSVGAVHQREEQSRSYVELQETGNAKQFQQRYNSLHDQQHQSINVHTAFEDGEGVHGTATVYRGNPVRVDNELTDYGTKQRNPPVNSEAAREDYREIIKIIRDSIPEVKYTPARTPQINVQVYGSTVRDSGNKGQAMEMKQQEAAMMREQQIKAIPVNAEAQADKAQSQLQRILSESGGVQRYFNGAEWTRFQEQKQGNQQKQQQGHWQEVEPGHWKEQQQERQEQKQQQGHWQEVEPGHWKEQQQERQEQKQQQGHWQEVEPGHWQEQKQGNQQKQQQGHWQEVEPGHWQEQKQGNQQKQQQGHWQEVEPGHWQEQQQERQEQKQGNEQKQQQGNWQEVEPGHWKEQQQERQEQKQGNEQKQQQGHWQEVEPGHWKEQQHGLWQQQQQGHWQEIQRGHWQQQQENQQEQQQGNRQGQDQGQRKEQEQAQHQEQQQGNRQEQQQGNRQEQQQGNRQEQQQGNRQEQQQGNRQEQQQGNRQEQQQGNRQEQQQGNRQEQQQGNRQEQQQGNRQEQQLLRIYDTRLPQVHQQQSIILPYDQYDTSNKNLQQNRGNAVQETTESRQMAPLAYLPPPVAERIVHKTIHVPQPYPVEVPRIIEKKVPYPVEKIVERKVPYPVERIVEKKVPVPQPYPVHIQVPVDRIIEKQVLQPYPVHIEKIIEKKVPYPVQRLVPQPYPVHIIQPYPVEKIVEKPVPVPVTVEKIVEKKVHVPHPYPVQVPIKVPYPVEVTKYVEQSVHVPYGVRYGVSYQQIMKPQSTNGLYGHRESTSLPIYGLSLVSNQYRDRINVSNDFQGYAYSKPAVAFVSGSSESGNPQRSNGWEQFAHGKSSGSENNHNQGFAKKSYVGASSKLPQSIHNYPGSKKRQVTYRQSSNVVGGDNNAGNDEYVGPVPAAQQQQTQSQSSSKPHQQSRSRSSSDHQQTLLLQHVQQHSTSVTRIAPVSTSSSSSRRSRQQEENPPHYQNGPGAFRQSKIEYGFKPPMVPSVQYDEKTATKVEN